MVSEFFGFCSELIEKEFADNFPFLFGFINPRESSHEPCFGIDNFQFNAKLFFETCSHGVGFALAHEPRVDVDAGQLVTDRIVQEFCRDSRIYTARQTQQNAGLT